MPLALMTIDILSKRLKSESLFLFFPIKSGINDAELLLMPGCGSIEKFCGIELTPQSWVAPKLQYCGRNWWWCSLQFRSLPRVLKLKMNPSMLFVILCFYQNILDNVKHVLEEIFFSTCITTRLCLYKLFFRYEICSYIYFVYSNNKTHHTHGHGSGSHFWKFTKKFSYLYICQHVRTIRWSILLVSISFINDILLVLNKYSYGRNWLWHSNQ